MFLPPLSSDDSLALALSSMREQAKDWFDQAYTASKNSDYGQAIDLYTCVLEVDPEFSIAYNNRGYAYRQQEQLDRALRDFNKAIELNPRFSEAFNNRGVTYRKKGMFMQALSDFNQAIFIDIIQLKLCPEQVQIHQYQEALAVTYQNRGIAYYHQGLFQMALKDFSTAMALKPDLPRVQNYREWASQKISMGE